MDATLVKQPSAIYRWLVLILISLAMFGNYYIYDSISPLADLLTKQLKFSDSEIGLLNAIYSFPNIIMVLVGGLIIDKIGTRKSVFIFTLLITLGAVVTAFNSTLWLMATGRLIFGLGAESMIVAITTIIARWFKGKELSFAFGLNLSVARLGSFMALNSPTWGKSLYSLPKEGAQDKVILREVLKFGKPFWYITALCVVFYSAMFPFQTFAIKFFQEAHGTTREVGGNLSSMLTLAAMVFTPLFGLLSDKIGKRSLLMMFGSLLIIPVYLMMAYKFGRPDIIGSGDFLNININFFDIHAAIPKYLLLPMGMMGIAFSLVPAVMWPSVSLIVDNAKLGTAYGLMTMIQNIGLFGFNLLIGFANDIGKASASNPGGYNLGMWIFSSLGFFGLIFAFLLRKSQAGIGLELGSMHKQKIS